MSIQTFEKLPKQYHITPVLAKLDEIEREHGLVYYDGFLLSVRFYKDGRCELVSWVDSEAFDKDGPASITDLYLTCELDSELANRIVQEQSDFCFGDVYLQSGVKFHLEAYCRVEKGNDCVHTPATRLFLGTFLNVPTDFMPVSLAVPLKLS